MSIVDDGRFMARALALAERGRTSTHPNPRVGCVIVADGAIIGEGFHERAGRPHAEPQALAMAGARARGATVYVNLEPCCHFGHTPPCVRTLVDAGVARVVVAMEDPDPRVRGGGIASLRAAGVAVEVGIMETAARQLNRGFLARLTTGRPFVQAKVGASIDGRTALPSGASQWITSAAARADVQRLRAQSSAILTGIGTVRADNPALTVRPTPSRVPLRVIADSRLTVTSDARVLADPTSALVVTVTASGEAATRLQAAGIDVVAVGGVPGAVDLGALLTMLAQRGVNDLLVEAGPRLLASLIEGRWVDELIVYMAPCLVGEGRPIAALSVASLSERWAWRYGEVRAVGPDLRLTLVPER